VENSRLTWSYEHEHGMNDPQPPYAQFTHRIPHVIHIPCPQNSGSTDSSSNEETAHPRNYQQGNALFPVGHQKAPRPFRTRMTATLDRTNNGVDGDDVHDVLHAASA
jgi:hypothetical protein